MLASGEVRDEWYSSKCGGNHPRHRSDNAHDEQGGTQMSMMPEMSVDQWLLVTLTAGVGGSMLSIGSAAGVALMGQARGAYTFFGHLKWTWAIFLGYAASIAVHYWISGMAF